MEIMDEELVHWQSLERGAREYQTAVGRIWKASTAPL